jgi:hypothetical protein
MVFHTKDGCDDPYLPMFETVGEKRQEAWFPIVRKRLDEYVHNTVAAEVRFPDDVILRGRIVADHSGCVPMKHPLGLVEYVALKAATAH